MPSTVGRISLTASCIEMRPSSADAALRKMWAEGLLHPCHCKPVLDQTGIGRNIHLQPCPIPASYTGTKTLHMATS